MSQLNGPHEAAGSMADDDDSVLFTAEELAAQAAKYKAAMTNGHAVHEEQDPLTVTPQRPILAKDLIGNDEQMIFGSPFVPCLVTDMPANMRSKDSCVHLSLQGKKGGRLQPGTPLIGILRKDMKIGDSVYVDGRRGFGDRGGNTSAVVEVLRSTSGNRYIVITESQSVYEVTPQQTNDMKVAAHRHRVVQQTENIFSRIGSALGKFKGDGKTKRTWQTDEEIFSGKPPPVDDEERN